MNNTLLMVNKYLVYNDLFDKVLSVGGNNYQCRVKMMYNDQIYRFIDAIKKYSSVIVNKRINKATDEVTITFRRSN